MMSAGAKENQQVVYFDNAGPSFAASSPYAPPFIYPLPSSPPSSVSSSITRLCPVSLPWCRASEEEKSFYYVDDDDGTRQSAVSGSAGGGGFGNRVCSEEKREQSTQRDHIVFILECVLFYSSILEVRNLRRSIMEKLAQFVI
ncbi:hypothetical protein V9T40_003431 [Parthenolecanium corni]|uniref:Uncharacterized protein n=1 Tax=Parthenolecanium corni TaxID=536013 RepID=A0AAN9TT53_9HEMI